VTETYFQKGFNLKAAVGPVLARNYHSVVVDRLKELDFRARAGEVTVKLAREFGFCYGVDRAVEYAYETREKFPDRRIFLSGEIIHNPDVNGRLEDMGFSILAEAPDPALRYAEVRTEDVVVLPAFGVTAGDMAYLRTKGCVLVDTTCGSVLNVWKNVHKYSREGYTSVIHGKHYHEETKATASQTLTHPGGQYLCVKDVAETDQVCDFIRGRRSADELTTAFRHAASPGFDPDRDLQRIGLANQTTMLMSESLEIQERLRVAMRDRWGDEELPRHFRAFDTICSATQDRQDAVFRLLAESGLDLMIVIGGYNSSNTAALARICAAKVPTYHIRGPEGIEADMICHRAVAGGDEIQTTAWLPRGAVTLGLTAGASTPNNVVGEVVERLLGFRGRTTAELGPAEVRQDSGARIP